MPGGVKDIIKDILNPVRSLDLQTVSIKIL